MASELNEKAVLSYRLFKIWESSSRPKLDEQLFSRIRSAATPEEIKTVFDPLNDAAMIEMVFSDDYPDYDEQAIVDELRKAEEIDCIAIVNTCAKPLDIIARIAPDLCTDFSNRVSAQDKKMAHMLQDVAPNLLATLEI